MTITSGPAARPGPMRRVTGALAAATCVVLAGAVAGLGPSTAGASSHREAPLVAMDPAIDNTDLYAFVSPERPGYLTFVANWIPFEEPDGGPNFYPFATDAAYNIKVDNDGDARPDATFRWTFQNVDRRRNSTFLYNNGPVTSLDDENLLFRQTYRLESSFDGAPFTTRVTGGMVAPSRVGNAAMPDYAKLRRDATVTLPGGWKVFAGQADDPFFLDLRVFDLLYGGDLSETGRDTLAGYNVNSIALQVPFEDVALGGDPRRNPVIGVWATTDRPRVRISGKVGEVPRGGDRVQVSRLGNPLVNEVVVPAGLKDTFNSLPPEKDATIPAVVARVTNPELPRLVEGIYGVPAPATPRQDLVEIFLTGITTKTPDGPIKVDLNSQLNNQDVRPSRFRPAEMLRLNLSTPVAEAPNRLGVLGGDLQGFPNGRRLTDDAVDIALQAVQGAAQTGKLVDALAAGDRVDANDNAFGDSFPYLALPNVGAVNSAAGGGAGTGAAPDGRGAASAQPVDPSATPGSLAGLASRDGGDIPATTVATTVAWGLAGVAAALGTLLVVGWLRRRRRPAPVDSEPTRPL
ncbi:DUF4331 domain-containing protein [Plantactinospora sp. WMMB334]|uniref:DUF4331 domain-containing protein n=1 Tax=Plantactinospora sp. WMMB334 TaxID=3404119 RepID=UPI003B926DFF